MQRRSLIRQREQKVLGIIRNKKVRGRYSLPKGWKKVKGYRIDLDEMRDYPETLSCLFIKDLKDISVETEYFVHDSYEYVSDDADDLLERIYDDHWDDNDNFYDEPVK